MQSLHELGSKYGTDKATHHNYLNLYESNLLHLRNSPIRFLEIGISTGASLKMWEEYFTNAQIYGADIRGEEERRLIFVDKNIFFDESKTKTLVTNQESVEDLENLPDELDVIVDDGGHTMLQQQLTLKTIFKKLNSGGIYILEDLHTSTPDFWDGCNYGRTNTNNTLNLLNDLKKNKISENSNYFISENDFLDLVNQISNIEIVEIKRGSITSIIKKK